MATIYKRTKTQPLPQGATIKGKAATWSDADGNHSGRVIAGKSGPRVVTWESPVYSIKMRDHTGKRVEVPTETSDKKTAAAFAAKLEHDAMLRRRGLIDPVMEQMADEGKRPVPSHIEEFIRTLEAENRDALHVQSTRNYITAMLEGVQSINRIEPARILDGLKKLTDAGRSARTRNAYLVAVKSFTRWLAGPGKRLASDPLAGMKRMNEASDRRRRRRDLSTEEQGWLLRGAEAGPSYRGISGLDRAMLYRLDLGSGLRLSELGSLKPESFALGGDAPTVTVMAGFSKRRREDVQPIHPDLAALLVPWLRFKPAGVKVFKLGDRGGEMLAADMARGRAMWLAAEHDPVKREEKAKSDFLLPVNHAGRVADFHSLRHTYISGLVNSGVSVKVAQELARHSTSTLTIDRYTHARLVDLRSALPGVTPKPVDAPQGAAMAATGTYGGECDASVDTTHAVRGVSGAVKGPDGQAVMQSGEGGEPIKNPHVSGGLETVGGSVERWVGESNPQVPLRRRLISSQCEDIGNAGNNGDLLKKCVASVDATGTATGVLSAVEALLNTLPDTERAEVVAHLTRLITLPPDMRRALFTLTGAKL